MAQIWPIYWPILAAANRTAQWPIPSLLNTPQLNGNLRYRGKFGRYT